MELWHQYLIHRNRWAPFSGENASVEKADRTIIFRSETSAGASDKAKEKLTNKQTN